MNFRNILIIIALSLSSCISNDLVDKKYDITGNWVADRIQPSFIHANIRIPMNDSNILQENRIGWDFELQFNENFRFQIKEEDGIYKTGTYKLVNDTIILVLENKSHDWLKLKIDSISVDKIKLRTPIIFFQSVDANDTIEFMSGDNVQLTLKRNNKLATKIPKNH